MDKTTLKRIFFIRKFFLSPISYEKRPSKTKQFYAFFLFLIYTYAAVRSFCSKFPFYKTQNVIEMVLAIISDFNIYLSLILPIIRIRKMTHDWWYLLKNISQVSGNITNIFFLVLYISFCFAITFANYCYLKIWGFSYFSFFIADFFQVYALYFEVITAIEILQILKQCYQSQKNKLRISRNLNIFKQNFFLLKDCVDYFNEIFGWNILLFHIYVTCSTLTYIDRLVKNDLFEITPSLDYKLQLYLSTLLLIIFWVFNFVFF